MKTVQRRTQTLAGQREGFGETPHLRIGIPQSPFLTLDEGALFCRFDARVSDPATAPVQFRRWLVRQAIPMKRVGRNILVERWRLELAMENA